MIMYHSKEWVEALGESLRTDRAFAKAGRRLNGIFGFRTYDCPDGKDRLVVLVFHRGSLAECRHGAKDAPWEDLRRAPFDRSWVMQSTTTFEMSAKLNRGQTTPFRALTSSDYKIEGNKRTLIMLIRAFNAWHKVAARIQCQYEYNGDDLDALTHSLASVGERHDDGLNHHES
jgi:hypothetical protein